MNKRLTLFDSQRTKDISNICRKTWAKSEIIFKSIDTGKVLLTTHNKVLLAGSQFVAQRVFDLAQLINLQTYNDALELTYPDDMESGDTTHKVCLFCCGTKGCGSTSSAVREVVYSKRIWPKNDIVPFRYPLIENDLSTELRAKYFGRKEEIDDHVGYYFKAFETAPTLHIRNMNGEDIDETIYQDPPTYVETPEQANDAETFVEMSLQITKDDFREYFKIKGSPSGAEEINSISLLTANYKIKDGIRYYQDILPFTQLNIPNEPLKDETKGIDITYHIYF